jgi:phosphotransferase system HPr (HPr) family protein
MSAIVFPQEIDVVRARTVVQHVRRTFVVNTQPGLHARPCALLVQALQAYRSTAEVEVGAEKASGKSILGLMMLAAGYGSEITFTIVGEDAIEAMAAVHRLFDVRFEVASHALTASSKPAMALTGAGP